MAKNFKQWHVSEIETQSIFHVTLYAKTQTWKL